MKANTMTHVVHGSDAKKLAPQRITKDQREWLETRSIKTGNTIAAVIRILIQNEINLETN